MQIALYGSNFLRRNSQYSLDPACRFDGYQETVASFVSSSEVRCNAPLTARGGPNPSVRVEVSNNGDDWTTPQFFQYKTYCGGTTTLSQDRPPPPPRAHLTPPTAETGLAPAGSSSAARR